MARIRSIHPGLFTDESFVSCSPLARLLVLGLWTEADDQGVFEWKPVTLKMRLLPVDGADVPALLGEIAEHNIIKRFEANGKSYGAVRNFRKYQRPKSPSAIHPLPADLRSYVAISETAGDEPAQFPPKAETTPQMEDGGGREGEEKTEGATAPSLAVVPKVDYDLIEKQCREAAGLENETSPGLMVVGPILRLVEAGASMERDILPVLRAAKAKGSKPSTWTYFLPAIERAMKPPEAIKAIPAPPVAGAAMVFVELRSEQWDAWEAFKGRKIPSKYYPEHEAEGWLFQAAWPPGYVSPDLPTPQSERSEAA